MKSPVILGVSEGAGKYMTGFKTVAAMVSAMVDSMGITVPVALHLDHGTYEGCKACIEAGFSSIMFDGSHYSIEENVEKTKELVALAHAKGLSIEQRSVPSAVSRTASWVPARSQTPRSAQRSLLWASTSWLPASATSMVSTRQTGRVWTSSSGPHPQGHQ